MFFVFFSYYKVLIHYDHPDNWFKSYEFESFQIMNLL